MYINLITKTRFKIHLVRYKPFIERWEFCVCLEYTVQMKFQRAIGDEIFNPPVFLQGLAADSEKLPVPSMQEFVGLFSMTL